MHLRLFNVATDVPLGDLSATQKATTPNGSADEHTVEVEIPPTEKAVFENWLRELWQEKDQFISRYLITGHTSSEFVDIPIRLRRNREYLDPFCFFIPAALGYLWRCWIQQS